MTTTKTALFSGIAALALIGSAGYALAHAAGMHTMTVRTPDGGVATIEYSGNVAPKITFGAAPIPSAFLGARAPFAAFDRISAEMNHEMDVLLRQAGMLTQPAASTSPFYSTMLQGMPSPGRGYSWTAAMSGNGVCTRTMRITRNGNAKPHIVASSSGDCAGAASDGLTSAPARALPNGRNGVTTASDRSGPRLPHFRVVGYTMH